MVTTTDRTYARTDDRPPVREGSSHRSRRRRLRRPLALLIALGFFFGPLGAYLLGVRATAFENHALAPRPSLSDGWAFFPELTKWGVDHLPLRDKAVHVYTSGSERVFGQPPAYGGGSDSAPVGGGHPAGTTTKSPTSVTYPEVIQGKNGWLYYGQDVSNKCQPTRTVQDTLKRLNELAAAVKASGRRFVFTIAPDKSTVFPANLPDDYAGAQCAAERRTAFWKAIDATPPTGYFDLRGPLEAEQKRTGPIYRPTDTHWAPHGAVIYTEQLAKALDPALLKDTKVDDLPPAVLGGDLAAMLGTTSADKLPEFEVDRPGVTPVGRAGMQLPDIPTTAPVTATDTTTGAPLFQPKTLLMGDSFTSASLGVLGGLFANVSLLHSETAAVAGPQVVADAMANSDVVVFEIVERSIGSGRASVLDDASLAAIKQTLAAHPR